jgi:hypothetical protein
MRLLDSLDIDVTLEVVATNCSLDLQRFARFHCTKELFHDDSHRLTFGTGLPQVQAISNKSLLIVVAIVMVINCCAITIMPSCVRSHSLSLSHSLTLSLSLSLSLTLTLSLCCTLHLSNHSFGSLTDGKLRRWMVFLTG